VPGATYVSPVDGAVYRYVPAGEFIMGSSDEQVEFGQELCRTYWHQPDDCNGSWIEDEQPQHTVYLDSYWIMETEVTNAQYGKFIEADGYTTETYWSADGWTWRSDNAIVEPRYWEDNRFNNDLQPVVAISWYETEAYANWLSAETGLDFRLPTEAQWEKAARGTDGDVFPWGSQWNSSYANYCEKNCTQDWADQDTDDGYQYTAPVGSYKIHLQEIRKVHLAERFACCGVVRGSTFQATCAPPSETGTFLITGAAVLGSGCWLSLSPDSPLASDSALLLCLL